MINDYLQFECSRNPERMHIKDFLSGSHPIKQKKSSHFRETLEGKVKTFNSLNIDEEVITNESEIANALNSFYVNAYSKYTHKFTTDLHDDIAENIKNLVNMVNEKVNGNTLFALPEMSTEFVLKQLRSKLEIDGIGWHWC